MAARRVDISFDDLRLLPIQAAAKRYHCSVRTLTRAIEFGELEAYKPGATRMVDLDSGDAWFLSKQHKTRHYGKRKR